MTEGEKLSLKCHVSGSSPMTVQWLKDRRELKSGGNTRITFVSGTACLEVGQVSMSDAGDYLCKASNSSGSSFCKSRVTVKGEASLATCTVTKKRSFTFSLSGETFHFLTQTSIKSMIV